MVAAQAKSDGDSNLALKLVPAFSADEAFLTWCERLMDNLLGTREKAHEGGLGGDNRGHT